MGWVEQGVSAHPRCSISLRASEPQATFTGSPVPRSPAPQPGVPHPREGDLASGLLAGGSHHIVYAEPRKVMPAGSQACSPDTGAQRRASTGTPAPSPLASPAPGASGACGPAPRTPTCSSGRWAPWRRRGAMSRSQAVGRPCQAPGSWGGSHAQQAIGAHRRGP